MKLVTWHIYTSYWIPQQEAILLHSFTHTLSRQFIDFIIPHNMGHHFIQHVCTQGCNPPCVVTLLNGNFQLIPQQGVPNVSIWLVGSFALRCTQWIWGGHVLTSPRCGRTTLHVHTIMMQILHVCGFCFPSIFIWFVIGIWELMNLWTCMALARI